MLTTFPRRFAVGASLLFSIFMVSGCVSTGPAEPVEPGTVEMDRNQLPSAPDPGPPAVSPSARAVAALISDAEREYDRGDWDAAIATAERALRIDRRQPDVYLIIARSYRASGEPQQALQFAQQGLRYVNDPDSEVAKQLNWLSEMLR